MTLRSAYTWAEFYDFAVAEAQLAEEAEQAGDIDAALALTMSAREANALAKQGFEAQ